MSNSSHQTIVGPDSGPIDGEVRHRTRRWPIWIEKPSDDPIYKALVAAGGGLAGEAITKPRPLEMGPKEYAQQVTFEPVRRLISSLVGDRHFLGVVERLRAERDRTDLDELLDAETAAYVPYRRGAPWAGMRRAIELTVFSNLEDPQARVLSLAATGCAVDALPAPGDPAQWTHAKRYPEAAAMLVARGARLCPAIRYSESEVTICRTELRQGAVLYCGPCRRRAGDTDTFDRSDREAISALLSGVAVALRV